MCCQLAYLCGNRFLSIAYPINAFSVLIWVSSNSTVKVCRSENKN